VLRCAPRSKLEEIEPHSDLGFKMLMMLNDGRFV
jgi:hypothetical protein